MNPAVARSRIVAYAAPWVQVKILLKFAPIHCVKFGPRQFARPIRARWFLCDLAVEVAARQPYCTSPFHQSGAGPIKEAAADSPNFSLLPGFPQEEGP